MCKHINNKHTRFPLYGCSMCHFSSRSTVSVSRHMANHGRAADSVGARAHVTKLCPSRKEHKKMKEMFEVCFGVKLS
ncbi:hypothetical protein KIN20_030812 [Parelaphostrongylus tenuis]|uniref:C2H2-type domain-containing protein n=1 Tax=Parelaphostrongylus tenuis TaxID=148309 RepID=A0AAD5R498_PARTN|nr:hypothetical protein KIN20_030812 [Parelaphostrongylus tenuis]